MSARWPNIRRYMWVVPRTPSQDFTIGAPVNAALTALEADGTLAKLADKFFTDKFTITYDQLP